MPETEVELSERNVYLLRPGITSIWFPKKGYDYIEQILRLARNEMRYRGNIPGVKKKANDNNDSLQEPNPRQAIQIESTPTAQKNVEYFKVFYRYLVRQ